MRSESFDFARAFAYVARALAFISCIFVVASSLLKIVKLTCTLFRRDSWTISSLAFSNVYGRASETGGIYIQSDSYKETHDRTSVARPIAMCTFNRPILWSAILSIILQHLFYLYKSRILMQNRTQDPMRLRRTTVALNSASFERVLFHHHYFGKSLRIFFRFCSCALCERDLKNRYCDLDIPK